MNVELEQTGDVHQVFSVKYGEYRRLQISFVRFPNGNGLIESAKECREGHLVCIKEELTRDTLKEIEDIAATLWDGNNHPWNGYWSVENPHCAKEWLGI